MEGELDPGSSTPLDPGPTLPLRCPRRLNLLCLDTTSAAPTLSGSAGLSLSTHPLRRLLSEQSQCTRHQTRALRSSTKRRRKSFRPVALRRLRLLSLPEKPKDSLFTLVFLHSIKAFAAKLKLCSLRWKLPLSGAQERAMVTQQGSTFKEHRPAVYTV
ncbi:unnamed protein product [Boreogadus saida]